MKTSAGVIIINELYGRPHLLLGHATGQKYWDLPKGGIEPGEDPREAAIRETLEETGVVINDNLLLEIGLCDYTPKKNLHLFTTAQEVDARTCVCKSWFHDDFGNVVYEMDAFKWVPITESQIMLHCGKSMSKLLISLFKTRFKDLL